VTAPSDHAPDTTAGGTFKDAADDRYPWIALSVVLIGTLMVILDGTIVNVALPQIGEELRNADALDWIITGYLLALGVAQPATGWLADRFGRKPIFTWSLALFGLGSLLCALSPNLTWLIAFRVLQGLGGGAMFPVGMAMIYELFPPHRRGAALGVWGIAAMAGPAIGPVLGGWLVTTFAWRSIFLINVPLGVLGVIAAIVLLRDTGYRESRPLDVTDLLLVGIALTLLLYAFSNARNAGWGATSTLVEIGVGLVALTWFTVTSLRRTQPLLELRMFAVPAFSLTIVVVWLITASQFARLVFIPIELETLHGMTALRAGLVLAPAALAAAVAMPIGGRLADSVGARIPVGIGSAAMAVGVWILAHLSLTTPMWVVIAGLSIQGLGIGFALMPSSVVALNAIPQRYVAQGTAVRAINRQIAGALGVALLSTYVASRIGVVSGGPMDAATAAAAQSAYNGTFVIAFWLVIGALAISPFLPGKAQNRAYQRERQVEHEKLVAG